MSCIKVESDVSSTWVTGCPDQSQEHHAFLHQSIDSLLEQKWALERRVEQMERDIDDLRDAAS